MHGWPVANLGPDEAQEVKDLLYRKQVLSFPGQKLTPEGLIAFGRTFGDLQYHVLQQYTLPGYSEIFVLSNEIVDGKRIGHGETGFFWHTDMSYMRRTTAYTILYAVKAPSKGGNTKFASSLAAYEKLPVARKADLAKLQTVFSYRKLHREEGYAVPLTPEQLARTPDVIHPLVRTHPFTGQQVLYLGSNEVAGFVGLETKEATKLMADLLAYATQAEFVLDYKWTPGDLVIWDNRGLLHMATEYDRRSEVRTVYRVSIEGEEPY